MSFRSRRHVTNPLTPRRKRATPRLEFMEDRVLLAVNPIVAENQLPGTPASVWSVPGAGDPTLQGFSTDISVNHGQTVSFKINDQANVPYHIDIYRMGYYQGNGARLVTTIPATQTLDQVQPAPLTDHSTGLVDAGNWAVSASWAVPATATSGLYFARIARDDTGGASMIYFIVRADDSHSAILFQTSDETWQAYNTWGGSSLYQNGTFASGGGVAVSYNRPLTVDATAGGYGDYTSPMHSEYPMIRFLEQNGYDVSYFTDVDAARNGNLILNHQVYMDVGHDEYWSQEQYSNVMAARDAGVNLAFFSGDEVYWKTRWQPSIDGSNTNYRTVVTYKESTNGPIDPSGVWTGTWRDARYSPPQTGGGQPENALTGTMFMDDRTNVDLGISLNVPYSDAGMRIWRNTAVAGLQPGQTATLGQYIVGYEVNEDVNNGFRPAGLIDMSSTTFTTDEHVVVPWGTITGPGTGTHSITLYRASSGALVFDAGTVQWSWGLDGNHNDTPTTADPSMQQATINILADMYVEPGTLMPGLDWATPSTDFTPPTSVITAPLSGAALTAGVPVTITGTASDKGGGIVAGVEVSTDGGQTWQPATGRGNWSFTWIPSTPGQVTIETRAVDDSANLETPSDAETVNVTFTATSTRGLVASYNFDQGSGSTLQDQSGNGQIGAISNATWSTQGHTGGALAFNGTNSLVSVPASSALDLASGMTLEAWVDPSKVSGLSPVIFKEGSSGSPYSLYSTNNNEFNTLAPDANVFSSGGTAAQASPVTNVPAGAWTFLAATYDGSTLTLYVNGKAAGSVAVSGNSLITSTGNLDIGGSSVLGQYFQGLIDDVRIYNRPLSLPEIQADMSTPIGGTLDATPPIASIASPEDQATVSGTTPVTANASDNIGIAGVQFLLNGAPLGNEIVAAPYTFAWNTARYANGSYVVSARVRDMAGNVITTTGDTVTVNNPHSTTPPTVSLTNPQANVLVGNPVLVSAVATDPTAVTSVQFQVNGSNVGAPETSAPYRLPWSTTGLSAGTYSITAVATDLWGNRSTSSPVTVTLDNAAPTLTGQTPGPGAWSMPVSGSIAVTFSEPVQPSSVGLTVAGPNGPVAGTIVYSSSTNTATFYPTSNLSASTNYTVALSGVMDVVGNTMPSTSWSFTTASAISGAALWPVSTTPTNPPANDSRSVEVGVKFQSDTSGYITGIAFYKQGLNTGTHIAHLWSSSGTLLASATFANETAYGWQVVSFSSPVAVSANTTYVASYLAPAGGYSFDTNYYQSSVDNAPLHALSSATSGGNGVYLYTSTGGLPNNSSQAANYWVTPIFATSSQPSSPLTITASSPSVNAGGVILGSPVTVTFSEPVTPSSIVFTLTGPGGAVPATVTYNSTTHTATLTPSAPLAAAASYTVSVSGATDSSGNVVSPATWSFTTQTDFTNASLWPSTATPTVASVSDGSPIEVGVKFTSDVAGYITGIRFYKGATNSGTHVAHLWTASGTLLASATFTSESAAGWQQVNFANPVAIAANTTYVASYYSSGGYFAIDSGYFASSGLTSGPLHAPSSPSAGGNGVYFESPNGGFPSKTANSANYWVDVVFSSSITGATTPKVVSTTPGSGATSVSPSDPISATFNEAILQNTVVFTLSGPSGAVPAAVSYNSATNTATLTPNSSLATNTTYTATIRSATDSNGNVMSPLTWSFTTGTTVSGASLWPSTATPSVASASDGKAIEVGVKFTSDLAGYITGIRFYKGATNSGTHVAHLWTASGTLLATATFTSESAAGWQQVNFANPVAITAKTTYVASYYSPDGYFAINPGYFSSSGQDSGPLHAPSSPSAGGNGVYFESPNGGFPTTTTNAANYWVDVVFSSTVTAPTVPTVVSTTPASAATGVSLSAPVTASFNEAVQQSTITFTLTGPSGAVPATLGYNSVNNVATLTPSGLLAANSTYTVAISGATDASGNVMDPVTWSFTTGTAITGASLWPSTATPTLTAASDGSPIEVGVKFTSDLAGYITGIRFYKGATNTGTHVAHLWTASGTMLASATFTSESAAGWQQVNFTNPVAIAANTTYVASYYSPGGYFAIDSNYFASNGQDSGPLHAPSSPSAGGNGVYFESPNGGFPTKTTNAANYWVDVVFSSTTSSSSTPTVLSTSPTAAATGVSTSAAVSATFSEPVQPGTITFTLASPSGSVPATLSYDSGSNTATITPNAPLATGTQYTATISGATDSSGNVMTTTSWVFTTGRTTTNTLPSDFSGGTFLGTAISNPTTGGIQLGSSLRDDFTGSSLSSAWTSTAWSPSAADTVSGGILSVAANEVIARSLVASDTGVEGSISFTNAYQHFGMATDLSAFAGNYWAIFSTMGTTSTLYARVNVNGATQDVSLGALPSGFHTYKVLPVSTGFAFYVDGTLKTTIAATVPAAVTLNPILSDFNGSSGALLQADWVRAVGGTYVSSVFDAGQSTTWLSASWTATLPTGTSVVVQTTTSTDGANWSPWAAVSNGGTIASPAGRYFKYRILLISPDSISTPVLNSISFTWA